MGKIPLSLDCVSFGTLGVWQLMGLDSLKPSDFAVLAGRGAFPSASICAAPGPGFGNGVVCLTVTEFSPFNLKF